MAVAMATFVTAVPVVNNSLSMRSVSHFNGGVRLNMAAPRVSRSARTFVVRAAEDPNNIVENVKKTFSGAEKDAEKNVDKASSQAKGKSTDLQGKAEDLQGEAKAKVDEVSDSVKSSVEDLQNKVQGAVDSGKQ